MDSGIKIGFSYAIIAPYGHEKHLFLSVCTTHCKLEVVIAFLSYSTCVHRLLLTMPLGRYVEMAKGPAKTCVLDGHARYETYLIGRSEDSTRVSKEDHRSCLCSQVHSCEFAHIYGVCSTLSIS
jgi:hypothetical protein